jgi:hypothetical protein
MSFAGSNPDLMEGMRGFGLGRERFATPCQRIAALMDRENAASQSGIWRGGPVRAGSEQHEADVWPPQKAGNALCDFASLGEASDNDVLGWNAAIDQAFDLRNHNARVLVDVGCRRSLRRNDGCPSR